jgi:4-hydroxy-3-methylbut-2-en-1-yl diphosphate synthase IspG/GcpE
MRAVEHVDKIRINPGNYADKKKFAVREYTDTEYENELERIAEVFSPLVVRARELGVSMRIGTNHGSLSDRIMNRYGDTPEGMVESALEFVRICEDHGYRDLILSMKSSNPVVVQQVYRLLAVRMAELEMDYPIHLGVTEAGDGEDGRIKSALGIGTLLEEGIGDTVRVSLTEDPVAEIPVARRLVERYAIAGDGTERLDPGLVTELRHPVVEPRDPFRYRRQAASTVRVGPRELGDVHTVLVEVPLTSCLSDQDEIRRELDREAGVRVPEETRAEVAVVGVRDPGDFDALAGLRGAMELVAPKVALAASVDAGPLRVASEDQLLAWLGTCHRLDVRISELEDVRTDGTIARVLRAAAEAHSAVMLEAGPPPDSSRDTEAAVELAVAAATLASRTDGARLMLGLAPVRERSPLQPYRLLAARLAESGLATPRVIIDDATARGDDPVLGFVSGSPEPSSSRARRAGGRSSTSKRRRGASRTERLTSRASRSR